MLQRCTRLLAALGMLTVLSVGTGCAPLGPLRSGLGTTLRSDLQHTPRGASGSAGSAEVDAAAVALPRFRAVIYWPRVAVGRAPAVVFLPGRFAPEDQYESYARALASRGFVVAVRAQYSWFYTDAALRRDAIELADWLRARRDVDPSRVAVAGHSMGGRDAIGAAADDPRFSAVVAVDPGTIEYLPHATEVLARVHAPLLIVGADMAWRAMSFCGRQGTNYVAYFALAPESTTLLELHNADHVQVMDSPDAFGYGVCRVGTADSGAVRRAARGALVEFFAEHMQGEAHREIEYGPLATRRVRGHRAAVATTAPESAPQP